MIKRIIKRIALRNGYLIVPVSKSYDPDRGFVLHSYEDGNGKFSFDRYRQVQIEGNKRKLDHVWVKRGNIEFLARYILQRLGKPSFGLCHGTRRGMEQAWFSAALGCEVLGTEISDTANQFPNTIQWDFHEVKPEWLSAVDFVYSNSFDHSYDPEKCLKAWMSCVRPGGLCIIEHSAAHGIFGASELDPFGAELRDMPYLVTRWGEGRFVVREIIDVPQKSEKLRYHAFIVIQHFPDSSVNLPVASA